MITLIRWILTRICWPEDHLHPWIIKHTIWIIKNTTQVVNKITTRVLMSTKLKYLIRLKVSKLVWLGSLDPRRSILVQDNSIKKEYCWIKILAEFLLISYIMKVLMWDALKEHWLKIPQLKEQFKISIKEWYYLISTKNLCKKWVSLKTVSL